MKNRRKPDERGEGRREKQGMREDENVKGTDAPQRRHNYNDPSYYHVTRREIPHGESERMDPARMEDYQGFYYPGYTGRLERDYEHNIGYREAYEHLDSTPSQGYENIQWGQKPEGVHRGKGPRTYTRGDDRILENINDALYEDPDVDATDIEATVKDGEVTLAGTVTSRNEKWAAEDLAEEISGVKNVINKLRIKRT